MIIFYIIIVLFLLYIVIKKHKRKHANQSGKTFNVFEHLSNKRQLIETVTSLERGTWSERELILKLLKNDFPAGAIFHDLYILKPNGQTSQIDLVLATKVGLIVFEVKDYSGWIFGKGNQQTWTQVLSYGQEKNKFYNPILQNKKHIDVLRKQSKQFGKIPIYSVIVFFGSCSLRNISFIPKDTIVTTSYRVIEAIQTIISENGPANYTDKHEIVRILKQAVLNGNDTNIQENHITQIEDMIGKNRLFE